MEKIIKVNIIFIILFIVFSSFSNVFAADLQTSLKVIKEASETGYLEDDQGYIEERIVSSDSENGELTVQLSVNNKEKDNSTEITKYENTEIFILVPEIPSSAYNLTKVSPVRLVYSEKNSFWASRLLSWSVLSVETRQ